MSKPKAFETDKNNLSGNYVREVSGVKDEQAIKAILTIGASKSEIQQACDYCFEQMHVKSSRRMRPMDDRVKRIIDILDYSRDCLD